MSRHGASTLRTASNSFNDKRFKNKGEWEVETLDRLTSWGFNMLMGGDGVLRQRGMAHAIVINVGDTMATLGDEFDITPNKSAPCTAFPNVFHPKFRKWCEHRINLVCKSQADNPWLFGYFIDNELCWWGHGSNYGGLFDTVMKKSADHTAKLALRDFLAKKANNDVAAFNKTWETSDGKDGVLIYDHGPFCEGGMQGINPSAEGPLEIQKTLVIPNESRELFANRPTTVRIPFFNQTRAPFTATWTA